MKILIRMSFLLLILVGILGCKSYSAAEVEDAIVTSYPDGFFQSGNKVKAGWALEVLLINTSDACVVFPFNYGVKIYHQEDEKINFIANLVDYTSKNEIFLTPEGELSSQRLIAIEPDLTDFSVAAPQELHATITGHLCDDENVVITKQITFFVVP